MRAARKLSHPVAPDKPAASLHGALRSGARRCPVTARAVARCAVALGGALVLVTAFGRPPAGALGEPSAVDLRGLDVGGGRSDPRPSALRRLAWEVRKRTSVETRLVPTRARLTSADLFASPILWWTGDDAFPALSDAEVAALRRFVVLGGFVVVDDASPDAGGREATAFERAARRELGRAFPETPLARLPASHTIYRSFYLASRPVGRVAGPDHLEAITLAGRVGVVLTRHDLGGALARDNFGTWEHEVTPGGDAQRESATRLAVNLVLYALCLDYKDDQVHAPFIMRRRGGSTAR